MYQSADSGGCAVVRGGLRDRRGEYNEAESLGTHASRGDSWSTATDVICRTNSFGQCVSCGDDGLCRLVVHVVKQPEWLPGRALISTSGRLPQPTVPCRT